MNSSGDDEYLRSILVPHKDAVHPKTRELWPVVMRSLEKPAKRGFANAFFSSLRMVNHRTPGGLYVGRSAGYRVDHDRVNRIMEKIVRGLFHHEFRKRIPRSYEVLTLFVNTLRGQVPDHDFSQWHSSVCGLFGASPQKQIGQKVLVYRCGVQPGAVYRSAWGLTFYGGIHFTAFVESTNRLRTISAELPVPPATPGV